MRKIIIGTLVVGCMLLASDKAILSKTKSKLFDFDKVKSEETRDFLDALETTLPLTAKVIKDYYEAKTCTKEFYNEVAIDDVKEFVTTSPFGVLFALSILSSDKKEDAKDNEYSELINTYKFMNCGKGDFKAYWNE